MVDKLNLLRKVDSLGRIVIPKSVRDKMGIKENDELELAFVDGWLGMRKVREEGDRKRVAREVLEEMGLEVPKELMD